MVRFETVKEGDVLYDVRMERMGHTTMRRQCWYRVEVMSIDHAGFTATVRWNWNAPQTYHRSEIARLRRTIPKKLAEAQGLDTVTP